MQFCITAYDYKDEGALDRRMSVRPSHLENIMKIKEEGHVICAGGFTKENGDLQGSVLIMEYPSREELDAYLESEPYVKAKVWEKITVEPCNILIR